MAIQEAYLKGSTPKAQDFHQRISDFSILGLEDGFRNRYEIVRAVPIVRSKA